MLKAKNKILNLMSSTVNHEMVTPLRCIESIVDLLKRKKYNDTSIRNNLNIVADTTRIVLAQIKKQS
jgi:light-regulated signal transduction histidine kinase (bacteriophytochrome)